MGREGKTPAPRSMDAGAGFAGEPSWSRMGTGAPGACPAEEPTAGRTNSCPMETACGIPGVFSRMQAQRTLEVALRMAFRLDCGTARIYIG